MIKIGNKEYTPADTSAAEVEVGVCQETATPSETATPTEAVDSSAEAATVPTEEVVAEEKPSVLDAEIPTEPDTPASATPEAEPSTVDALREAADRLMAERTQMTLEREMAQVSARFPELRELGDIVRLGRYPEIKGMVGRGYSLSDAVRLAYEDVYLSRREQAAALQARTSAYSTSHLHPTRPIGEGRSEVSETQIREYIDAIPGATREQAIAAYRKYKVGK